MDRQQEFVLRTIEERDIRFVRLWFTDVLGSSSRWRSPRPSSRARSPRASASTAAPSRGSPGSTRRTCSPSPTPPRSRCCRGAATTPAPPACSATSCCRTAVAELRRLRATCSSARWPRRPTSGSPSTRTPRSSSSCSSSRSTPGSPPVPVDQAGYFDHVPHGTAHDFRRAAITMLESMGISVEFSHHEVGPGQNEIDLRYADALTTADNIMTFRTVIKEVALEQGVFASFMPKPLADQPGLGHAHAPVAVRGRPQRLPRGGRAVPAQQGGPAVHRRPAAARRRDHRGHQPVGQLLQAALGRRRGAGLRLLGPQQPLRAGPGADVQAEQGPEHPGRGPRRWTRPATPTSPSR